MKRHGSLNMKGFHSFVCFFVGIYLATDGIIQISGKTSFVLVLDYFAFFSLFFGLTECFLNAGGKILRQCSS